LEALQDLRELLPDSCPIRARTMGTINGDMLTAAIRQGQAEGPQPVGGKKRVCVCVWYHTMTDRVLLGVGGKEMLS